MRAILPFHIVEQSVGFAAWVNSHFVAHDCFDIVLCDFLTFRAGVLVIARADDRGEAFDVDIRSWGGTFVKHVVGRIVVSHVENAPWLIAAPGELLGRLIDVSVVVHGLAGN